LYERYHTREIRDLGGLSRRLPILAFFMLLFTLSSIGLPGLNGFAGEFLILVGMFQRGFAGEPTAWAWQYQVIAVTSVLGVVLGAWYMPWLVQRTFFGPLREPGSHHGDATGESSDDQPIRDLSAREICALAPLAVMMLWIGLVPNTFLQPMSGTLNEITAVVDGAYDEYYAREPVDLTASRAGATRDEENEANVE